MIRILLSLLAGVYLLHGQAAFPTAIATDVDLPPLVNDCETKLRLSAGASDTTLYVFDASCVVQNMLLTLDPGTTRSEIVQVSAIAGTALTVRRAQDGKAAQPHTQGSKVAGLLTARTINDIRDEIKAIETRLGADLANLTTINAVTVSQYAFSPQTPGGSLTAGIVNVVTLSPCPLGVSGTDYKHYLWLSGGTGTAEAVLITGGTCTSGATSGNINFTPAYNHSGAWTIGPASSGLAEAIAANPYRTVKPTAGTPYTIRATVAATKAVKVECEAGAVLTVDSAVSTSTDILLVETSTEPITWGGIENCSIQPASGSPGRYPLHVRVGNSNAPIFNFRITNNQIGDVTPSVAGFGSGKSIYLDNSGGYVDGIFTTLVAENSLNGGILMANIGDSVTFASNRVHGTGPAFDVSVQSVGVNLGASVVTLEKNNLYTLDNGCIVVRYGNRVYIRDNNLECRGTGSNDAMIDVQGTSSYPSFDTQITGNFFSMIGNYTHGIRLDRTQNALIQMNQFGWAMGTQRGLTCTGNTSHVSMLFNHGIVSGVADNGSYLVDGCDAVSSVMTRNGEFRIGEHTGSTQTFSMKGQFGQSLPIFQFGFNPNDPLSPFSDAQLFFWGNGAGTVNHYNQAPSGNTLSTHRAGAGQSTELEWWDDPSGTTQARMSRDGKYLTYREGSAVTAATTITPTAAFFRITGTTTIQGINLPTDFSAGMLCAVAVDGFSTNTAANLLRGSTVAAGQSICWVYLPSLAKWAPTL